jgi:hypothetical protein
MKTSLLIANEKLTASGISSVVFDQGILSIFRINNILSLQAGIFSRDGPFFCCK